MFSYPALISYYTLYNVLWGAVCLKTNKQSMFTKEVDVTKEVNV